MPPFEGAFLFPCNLPPSRLYIYFCNALLLAPCDAPMPPHRNTGLSPPLLESPAPGEAPLQAVRAGLPKVIASGMTQPFGLQHARTASF